MSFSDEEKTHLFNKLEEHTVCLAEIKKDLNYGSKEFASIKKRHTDFQETKEAFGRHIEHHKTANWLLGILGPIITAIAGWWAVWRGD